MKCGCGAVAVTRGYCGPCYKRLRRAGSIQRLESWGFAPKHKPRLEAGVCTKCGEKKPHTTEFFYRCAAGRDGLMSECKTCRNGRYKGVAKHQPLCSERRQYWLDRARPDPLAAILRRLMPYPRSFLPQEDAVDCCMEAIERSIKPWGVDVDGAMQEVKRIAMRSHHPGKRVPFEEWVLPPTPDFAPFLIEAMAG